MGLHRRLLWVHKTYSPEVFLRTLAVVGMRHGLPANYDAVMPDYYVGSYHLIVGSTPEDLASLRVQADKIASFLRSPDAGALEAEPWVAGADDLLRYAPDGSRFARHVPWVARVINQQVKHKDRQHARGAILGPLWQHSEGRWSSRRYDPPNDPFDRGIYAQMDSLRRYAAARRDPTWDAVTHADIELGRTVALLSEQLSNVADWSEAHPGVDLLRMPLHDAINASRAWHAELRERRRAEGARGHPGAVVYTWPDGWTAQTLVTKEQLEAEGEAMGHCVGSAGYLSRVNGQEVAILSIRDPNGDPHVTVELGLLEADSDFEEIYAGSVIAGEPGIDSAVVAIANQFGDKQYLLHGYVEQAKGKGNDVPAPKYRRRLRDLLKWVEAQEWGEGGVARYSADVWSDQYPALGNTTLTTARVAADPTSLPFVEATLAEQLSRVQGERDGRDEILRLYFMVLVNKLDDPQQGWGEIAGMIEHSGGGAGTLRKEDAAYLLAPVIEKLPQERRGHVRDLSRRVGW